MRIHHATAAKAKAHGLELLFAETGKVEVYATISGHKKMLASAVDPKDALDLALLEIKPIKMRPAKVKLTKPAKVKARDLDGEDELDGDLGFDVDDEDASESKSVVKPHYKTQYKPHHMTNGDEISQLVRKHFATVKGEDGGPAKLDWPRFVRFAKTNGCWSDSYIGLNNGLARMSCINRLRKKIKDGAKIQWGV